jgi:hypothetical protein
MALQKLITRDSGLSGSYIKVRKVELDRPALKLVVHISLHLDAAHSSSPSLCLLGRHEFIILPEQRNTDLTALAYTLLKTLSTYADAVDV